MMPAAVPLSVLPSVTLDAFEGPLDLLLHLIREHRIDIADIPIVQITDYYLGYLNAMEAMNLNVAGDFLVMAATLLEIKSRMLLPKAPQIEEVGESDDPRLELVQRLQDYQRYKAFVSTLSEWEDERRQIFFRGQAAYGDLYELPVSFGELSAASLLKALQKLLAEAGAGDSQPVTSVQRRKLTLRLAMAALWRKVQRGGAEGVWLSDCFEQPLVRVEIVLTFLALLELLRQRQIGAKQSGLLGEIFLFVLTETHDGI